MANFSRLKFFKKSEFPEPDKMDQNLLNKLDSLRGFLGKPIKITKSTDGAHVADSQHYQGKAVDIIVNDYNPLDLYFAAERFNFTGIGVYPHWWLGTKDNVVGGLHLDTRDLHETKGARWLAIKPLNEDGTPDQNGEQTYTVLNSSTIIEYFNNK